jgi:hypothetical protein
MIERDSLVNNPTPSTGQQVVALPNTIPAEHIQELARAIVRETGLVRDPAQEAAEIDQQRFIEGGREHWKAQVNFFQHIATASGAGVVGVTAVIGFMKIDSNLTTITLIVSMLSFLLASSEALFFLYLASSLLARFSWGDVPTREEAPKALTSDYYWERTGAFALFFWGVGSLAAAIYGPFMASLD